MNHLLQTILNNTPKPYNHYWSPLNTYQIIEINNHKEIQIHPNHIELTTYHPNHEYHTQTTKINNNDPTLLTQLQQWTNPSTT